MKYLKQYREFLESEFKDANDLTQYQKDVLIGRMLGDKESYNMFLKFEGLKENEN